MSDDAKRFTKITDSMKRIESKLDILISLLKLSVVKPEVGEEQAKILQLCDKKHTIEDMMKKTGKTQTNIKTILSRLRDKALITTKTVKDRVVYEKI